MPDPLTIAAEFEDAQQAAKDHRVDWDTRHLADGALLSLAHATSLPRIVREQAESNASLTRWLRWLTQHSAMRRLFVSAKVAGLSDEDLQEFYETCHAACAGDAVPLEVAWRAAVRDLKSKPAGQ